MVKISKNFEGSEYQNKYPRAMDQQFYDFINKEATMLKDF